MSSINGNGRGHLLITYIFNNKDCIEQIEEEANLKREIANLLSEKGYKFIITDDEYIDKKLIND